MTSKTLKSITLILLFTTLNITFAWGADYTKTGSWAFTKGTGNTDWTGTGGTYCSAYGQKSSSWNIQKTDVTDFSNVDFSLYQNVSLTITVVAGQNGGTNSFVVTLLKSDGSQAGSYTSTLTDKLATSKSGAATTSSTDVTFTPTEAFSGYKVEFLAKSYMTSTSYKLTYDNKSGGGSVSTKYTVVYSDNSATSGTPPTDANEYESGDEVTVLGNTGSLAKDGYTFGGWNTEDDGTGTTYAAGATFAITSNITLYPKWVEASAKEYTLVTDINDLAAGDIIVFGCLSNSVVAGTLSGTYLSSQSATITGSTLSSSNALEFTVGKSGDNWTFTSSTGLLGTSAAKNVSVSGSGTTTWTVSITSGTATVTSTTTSYGSLKYNSQSGSERFTTYTSGQTAIQIYKVDCAAEDKKDITWSNGGQGTAPAATTACNVTLPTTLSGVTGYTLDYWTANAAVTDSNDDTQAVGTHLTPGAKYTLTANTQFTAHWEVNTYTITLNGNGSGSTNGSMTINYDATAYFSITHVTRDGWTLDGYYSNTDTKILNANGSFAANAVSGFITSGKWTNTSNTLTLYAHWTCGTSVSVSKASLSHGDISFSVSEIATCDNTDANRQITITATPEAGWEAKAADISFTKTGTVTVTQVSAAVNSWVYRFNHKDNGSVTFNVTFTELPKYTVTFHNNAGTVPSAMSQSVNGEELTLPSATATTACTELDWEFAGWTTNSSFADTELTPSLIPAGAYTPEANIDMYAVFKRINEDCSGGGGGSEEVTLATSIAAGDVVYLVATVPTEGRLGVIGADDEANVDGEGWMPFTVESGGSGEWKLKNGSKYVTVSGKKFTLTASATTFSFEEHKAGKYYFVVNSTALAVNGTYYRFYSSAGDSYPFFYVYKAGAAATTTWSISPICTSTAVTGVTLNKTETTIPQEGSETLVATVAPVDASSKCVTWSSSDESVATVDAAGKVTGVAPGDAVITVTTKLGGKTATCNVHISAKAAETPTLDHTDGTSYCAENVTIKVSNYNAANKYYYTTNGTNPTNTSNLYYESGVVIYPGSTTLKVIAYNADGFPTAVTTATYVVTNLSNSPGTAYTVSQARALIDANNCLTQKVYVKGIVSQIKTAYGSDGGYISFNISDDGTTGSPQFEFYKNIRSEGEDWTALYAPELQVGKCVIGYGELAKYGSEYYFRTGNWLVENKDCGTPAIEVVEVDNDNNITIAHDFDAETTASLDKWETGTVALTADEPFLSKYFEATGNVKLVGIFNGTGVDIDPKNLRIRIVGNRVAANVGTTLDSTKIVNLGDYKTSLMPSGTEYILYSYKSSGDARDTRIMNCVRGKDTSGEIDMSEWIAVPWTTYSPTMSALVFGGGDAIVLEQKDGTTWKILDIIGALRADGKSIDPAHLESPAVITWGDWGTGEKNRGWYCADGKSLDTIPGVPRADLPLSTLRCLLVRKSSVKSGVETRKSTGNLGSGGYFNTLCSEWYGKQVDLDNEESTTCEAFAEVGSFDYEKSYGEYIKIDPDEFTATDNHDGTLTIHINPDKVDGGLAGLACEFLQITVKNKATDVDLATLNYKVPIIIDGTKMTNDALFTAEGEGCKECDVVVLKGATLKKYTDNTGGDMPQIRNLMLYPTATLNVPSGTNYTTKSIQFRVEGETAPKAILNGTLNTQDRQIVVSRRMKNDRFYFFSLPYDCKVADIRWSNGEIPVKGVDFEIVEYASQARANEGSTQGAPGHWQPISPTATLKAGVGYNIAIGTDKVKELVFPLALGGETSLTTAENNKSNTSEIHQYTGPTTINNHNWNLVSHPYVTQFKPYGGDKITYGKLVYDEGTQTWSREDETHVYITVPSFKASSITYDQKLATSMANLDPFLAVFVQGAGEGDITFAKANRIMSAPARHLAAAAELEDESVFVGVDVTGSNGMSDMASVRIRPDFEDKYKLGYDLAKYLIKGTERPQIYMLNDGYQLAFRAVNDTIAYKKEMPVGVYMRDAGTYTFTLSTDYPRDYVEAVYLLDKEAKITTDLLYNDYSLPTNGTLYTENRFYLTVEVKRPAPEVATDVDEMPQIETDMTRKILYNGQIYILRGGKVFDITGKQVR